MITEFFKAQLKGNKDTSNSVYLNLLLTDKEKYQDNKEKVKSLVNYYEQTGFEQVAHRDSRFRKLHNVAIGIINRDDFFKEEPTYKSIDESLSMTTNSTVQEVSLKFFPIIPNIVDWLVNTYSKFYSKYEAKATNPEAANEILENYSDEVRNTLVQHLQEKMLAENPQGDSQQIFAQAVQEISKKYNSNVRLEIEEWANHVINSVTDKYKIQELEKDILREHIITGHPFGHINYMDDTCYPEILEPNNCFWLKSPSNEDVSDSSMFGWFRYSNPITLINKYGHLMEEADTEKLIEWDNKLFNVGFKPTPDDYTHNRAPLEISINNYLTYKRLKNIPDNDTNQTLVRETNIYFLLPRKLGKLSININGQIVTRIVDENFKVTIRPTYSVSSKSLQNEYNLVSGEHIEWFYKNELWRAIKLDINSGDTSTEIHDFKTPGKNSELADTDTIWLFLDKNPYQPKREGYKYGVSIPVHGGPVNNIYGDSLSLVEKAYDWQTFYNFLWNKNNMLLQTEIGKFLLIDQNSIPQESMGETWNKGNLTKFFQVAHDLSLAPIDNSLTNRESPLAAAHGGYGQLVDLTKTTEILEKAQLASLVKNECLTVVGLNPQVFGDTSPYQSATSSKQGYQRTLTVISHLYDRTQEIMRKMYATLVDFEHYKSVNGGSSVISYITNDNQRIIFNGQLGSQSMYDLGIFIKNGIKEVEVIENIKQLAMTDNTMGADAFEKSLILASESKSEIIEKLRELNIQKQEDIQAQRTHEQEMQQQQINARQQEIADKIKNDNANKSLDREADLLKAQIIAIGYGNDNTQEVITALNDVRKINIQETDMYNRANMQNILLQTQAAKEANTVNQKSYQAELDQDIKLKELDLREEEIVAGRERTKAMLKNKK